MNTKFFTLLHLLFFCVSICALAQPPRGTGNWSLKFADNFNGSSVNTNNWAVSENIDWNKNGRQSHFRKQNAKVSGGQLKINNIIHQPSLRNGAEYTGAWLTSKVKYKYGYFEVRCRTASDKNDNYTWPTFWLWDGKNQQFPCEFDVFELHKWNTTPEQTVHYQNDYRLTNYGGKNAFEWHTYGMLWDRNSISFYIDGVLQSTSSRPNSQTAKKASDFCSRTGKQPLILSSSPNRENQPPLSLGSLPSFIVDYVKVWERTSGGGAAPSLPTVTIKGSNNKYVSSEDGLQAMTSSRGTASAWEKFTLVDAGGGKKALKCSNGKYVSSEDGLSAMKCDRDNIGAWEKFTLNKINGNTYTLKGSNGKYVSSEGGLQAMTCSRPSVGQWERFTITGGGLNRKISSGQDAISPENTLYAEVAPSSNRLTISGNIEGPYKAIVYTLQGRIVSSQKINAEQGTSEMTLQGLRSGQYILKLMSEEGGIKTVNFLY